MYVLPYDGARHNDDTITMGDLVATVWRRRLWILGAALLSVAAAVPYALHQTEWFRADVVLAPVQERSTPELPGQFGGLATLAGVTVGGGNNAEAITVLTSRDFIRAFIEDENLMPVLYADQWDGERGEWNVGDRGEVPDLRRGVQFFRESIINVQESTTTGIVTLEVEWTDPELAAEWANTLALRLNEDMRRRALQEAEANVSYLQEELGGTTVVTLEQSIGRLLENEMQKLMLARGNEEFTFRVLDRAEVPMQRVRPRRTLTVLLAGAFGTFAALFAVLMVEGVRRASGRQRFAGSATGKQPW